ncbi:hypothetical protein BaRGS_00001877, partial [Batillaria attramentaria]
MGPQSPNNENLPTVLWVSPCGHVAGWATREGWTGWVSQVDLSKPSSLGVGLSRFVRRGESESEEVAVMLFL